MNNLIIIKQNLDKQIEWIKKQFKDLIKPEPIIDDTGLDTSTEIIFALKEIEKEIKDYYEKLYRPVKEQADKIKSDEKSWLSAVNEPLNFIDKQIKEYNRKLEAVRLEELKKKAELEAEQERQRLEEQKTEALKSDNKELAEAIEESKKGVISQEINPALMETKHTGIMGTVTQKTVVTDLKIVNAGDLAKFLINSNFLNMIYFDKKTVTALIKFLDNNPAIKEIPGCYFIRDYETRYKKSKE